MDFRSEKGIAMSAGFQRLRVMAEVGAYAEEQGHSQELVFSLELGYRPAQIQVLAGSDQLENAHDYATAATIIQDYCQMRHHNLLEHLGLGIIGKLREAFPACHSLSLEIEKPAALGAAEASICKIKWSC